MQIIETRLLYYFLTVARERNITNAARMLHITQPTLSRQMALLEDEVGAKLFIRVCMRPLYPELAATSVLAWKREQPFGAAVSHFLEFAKCFLGMETA